MSGHYLALLSLEGSVSPLQLNLCFCWKPLRYISTPLTKFIFHGRGLREVPGARPGNERQTISAQNNNLLAVFSLLFTLLVRCVAAAPCELGDAHAPASRWGSWWARVSPGPE